MYYKLVIYPERKAKKIVDVFSHIHPEVGSHIYITGQKYQVLELKHYAREVFFDEKGNPKPFCLGDAVSVDQLEFGPYPELIVTPVSKY